MKTPIKLLVGFLILCLIGISSYATYRGYKKWKQTHAVRMAKEAIQKSDFNIGLLWLRKALEANPFNRDAVRMMGDFTEAIRSPAAVFWRNRLVELEPNSLTNRLMLARTAIMAREFDIAKRALDGVDVKNKNTAQYQKQFGNLSTATGQFLEAEKSFAEACRLDPSNHVFRLNHAMIQIQRKDPELAGQARAVLKELCAHAAVRDDALRHLTLDAMRHTNYQAAVTFAADLMRETNTIPADRLLHLNTLRAAKSSQFAPTLADYQRRSATNAARAFEMGGWMLASTSVSETHAWLQSLAPTIRTNLPVTLVVADTLMGLTNWTGLKEWVDEQFWGEMDHLRLAYSAMALRRQGMETAAKSEWAKAMKMAENRLEHLTALQRITVGWQWAAEYEEILWIIVNRYPKQEDAFQALANLLYASGRTRSLLGLYAQKSQSKPNELVLKNNLASLALLLNSVEHRPFDLAREVYEQQRDNPFFTATYAYALHLQAKTADGLKLLQQLKPAQLEHPSICGYYGVLLSAAGDKANAKKYLDLAAKTRVLPEENALFATAQK